MGAALTLGACSTDRELTEPDPVPANAERLAAALVDADDLTPGYTVVDGEGSPISTQLIPEHDCDDGLDNLKPKESASRDFTTKTTRLSQTVAYFPGAGGQVEQVFRDLAAKCASVVVTDKAVAIRTSPLDFGVLSDDTLAFEIELEPDKGAIEERDVIFMRAGDLVSVIELKGPRPSDKVLLDAATRVAIGYLGLLHDDTT